MDDLERVARAICLEVQFKDFGYYERRDGEMVWVSNPKQIATLDSASKAAARAALEALTLQDLARLADKFDHAVVPKRFNRKIEGAFADGYGRGFLWTYEAVIAAGRVKPE